MIWKERRGFARLAIEAKTVSRKTKETLTLLKKRFSSSQQTIIPMFTKNCREAVRAMTLGRRKSTQPTSYPPYTINLPLGFLRYIYEKTRLPVVPLYGMFPVKMM